VACAAESVYTIALDAMGGDKAPGIVIKGAAIAARKFPELHFLFVGDAEKVTPLLARVRPLKGRYEVLHAPDVVSSQEKPSQALRRGKHSSMRQAIEAVAQGKAQGIVSAGNTGALMAMAKTVLRTLPGITRPAIAGTLPTIGREDIVMLDLGADVGTDPEGLHQFAIMGDAYARTALGIAKPRIGLLNIGSEEMKGHDELKAAHQMLRNNTLGLNYVGFIEGDDIQRGAIDVVVSDGFTGNVALKSIEGAVKFFASQLKNVFRGSWMGRLSYLLARPALFRMKKRVDPRRYNGAMFLGLNGICVKSHGGADGYAFYHAIREAHDLISSRTNERIIAEMALLSTTKPSNTAREQSA
jgi:glycerol-3-phosphate acyltransferase PlsX